MTITLAGEQERWVADKVRESSYADPEHLAAKALKLLAARDERARGLESLRADIAVGWEQVERGDLLDGPVAMAKSVERTQRRLLPADITDSRKTEVCRSYRPDQW